MLPPKAQTNKIKGLDAGRYFGAVRVLTLRLFARRLFSPDAAKSGAHTPPVAIIACTAPIAAMTSSPMADSACNTNPGAREAGSFT